MLLTKLHIPHSKENIVHRSALFEKLNEGLNRKLILVSATAGYGKTTLVSDWIKHNKIATAWYSVDSRDNDAYEFINFIISGIQTIHKNIGNESLDLLKSPGTPETEYICELLINDLLTIKTDFLLVIDDLHFIASKEVFKVLSFITEYKPPHFKLAILTRSDPPLSLARLRSQNELLEIRSSDLSFSENDTTEFFNRKLKLELTKKDINLLALKTEGWIAGLQLTSLSLQGKESVGNFINKLKGDNRYIMDYLIEEVLQQQPQAIRDFLLSTSILNRFNASLCNYMLKIDNGQEIIELLEWKNMFIVPLDNERNWFRYHHLFASLLQHRLTVRFKDKIPELHASASQWFENNDLLVFALEHALAAGNKKKAINHFANVIDHLWKTSQYQTILQFGGMFTHEELIENVNLCLNYFWILFQTGNIEQAASLIYLLQNHTTDKAELAMVYVCINNLKVLTGDIESTFKYSELELQHINKDVDYWNILAFLSLGEAHRHRFELTKSYQSFDQAAMRAAASRLIYFEMVNRIRSSFVLWTLGDFSGAYKESKDLLDKMNSAGVNNSFSIDLLSSILYCKVGNFLVHINQIEEGLQKSVRGYELSKKSTNQLFLTSCTYLLAEAYYLAGEYNKAINIIEELDAIPYKQVAKYLCDLVDSLKCKLYLLTKQQDKLKPLFEKNIEANKSNAFEYILYSTSKARYQIEQGKVLEAIDLLQEVTKELKAEKGYGLLFEAELLQSKAYSIIKEQDKAIDYLIRALLRTQSAGLIRMYINEGAEIESLLKEIKQLVNTKSNPQLNKIDIEYINHLLRVFEKERTVTGIILEDSLSSRELDTLKLIAENLKNQEIAEAQYISINTVKTHVRNILLKLEAKNRNEAVTIAKEKGLLL